MRTRTLWVVSVLATAAVVAVTLLLTPRVEPRAEPVEPRASHPPADRAAVASPPTRAASVLGAWDRRRARAWARDDAAGLRALYVPGSGAGRRDVAMLAAYHRRGLRVTTMQRQVLAVRVRVCTSRVLSLVVTDRLAEGRVTRGDAQVVLPRSRPARHRVVLRRGPAGWRVAEVYDA